MKSALGNEREAVAALPVLNPAPLVGIVLALLVVLIAAIPSRTNLTGLALPVDVPMQVRDLFPVDELHVDFDGTLQWNDRQISSSELDHYFDRIGREPEDEQPEVRIFPDRLVRYAVIASIFADAARRHVRYVSIVGRESWK